jgi:hypothetical protein
LPGLNLSLLARDCVSEPYLGPRWPRARGDDQIARPELDAARGTTHPDCDVVLAEAVGSGMSGSSQDRRWEPLYPRPS